VLVSAFALGMSAVFVPPPQAARPAHEAANAAHVRSVLGRVTAGTLASVSQSAAAELVRRPRP
jgi:hypothetical protein